jgi:hypothetical protein
VTVAPVLSWIALGITFVIAGLGMATLLSGPSDPGDLPAPQASPDPAVVPQAPAGLTEAGTTEAGVTALPRVAASPRAVRRSPQTPAYLIAAHGVLATTTILLVLLAAIGAG